MQVKYLKLVNSNNGEPATVDFLDFQRISFLFHKYQLYLQQFAVRSQQVKKITQ